MMDNTHVATGIAIATLVVQPHDIPTFCATIVGGAVGGIIVVCLIIDWLNGSVLINSILNITNLNLIIGLGVILFSMIKGRFSQHRIFTHSISFLLLMCSGIAIFSIEIAIPFAIGFIFYILLDLMNKMPVKIFYPLKKMLLFVLGYASQTANKVISCISTFACIVEVVYFGWKIIF